MTILITIPQVHLARHMITKFPQKPDTTAKRQAPHTATRQSAVLEAMATTQIQQEPTQTYMGAPQPTPKTAGILTRAIHTTRQQALFITAQ